MLDSLAGGLWLGSSIFLLWIMKKICKVSYQKLLKGIQSEVWAQHFGNRMFSVDIYQDYLGRFFYREEIEEKNIGEVFVPLTKVDASLGLLYFQPVQFYTKEDNILEHIHFAETKYSFDEIQKLAPIDDVIYRVLLPSPHGLVDVLTPNHNGVWCNVHKWLNLNPNQKVDTFPIVGGKALKTKLKHGVRLGKLCLCKGCIYY